MTTLDTILDAIAELGLPQTAATFSVETAKDILQQAGVEDAEQRVDWLNVSYLDLGDLEALATVPFQCDTCDNCGAIVYRGEPDDWSNFQGVCEEEFYNVEGNLLGEDVDCLLCGDCYNRAAHILGI